MLKARFLLCILLSVAMSSAAIVKFGSVLEIQVSGHPEFSGRYTVGSDGTIDYPLLADISIIDLTTSELMNDLTFRLAKHIDNPLVTISIVAKPDITVTVLGQINKPGPVTAYLGATIQEAMELAGGPTEAADLSRVKVIRNGERDQDAEIFDLQAFLRDGEFDDVPRLAQDDRVILLSKERASKVKVIGAVKNPGFYDVEGKMSVFDLIYLAGGPAEKADLSRVRRFIGQGEKAVEQTINVQAYIDKGDLTDVPQIEQGDTIIVYSQWFDWKTFLSIMNNVLLFIVTVQSIRGALG